jgi:polar amino acid transport system substrate-binding protein
MTTTIDTSCLRRLRAGCAALTAIFSLIAIAPAGAEEIKLAQPGFLTVAFTGDMPGSGWQDGKLIGYDGEIMQQIAERLKLKVQPALMEWSGTIASVQAKRVDVMLGTMGWTEKRTKIMSLSEPIMYFRNGIMQSNKTSWSKLADLEGKKVGTITGFSFVPELRKIKDLELSLYDTADAAVQDLLNGRLDAVIGDPPVVQYAISRNPNWGVHFLAFEDNNPDYPLLTGLGQVVYGMNQENPALVAAVDDVLKEMWATCAFKAIGEKYGLTQDVWYKPVGDNFRAGVDRPKDYQLPTCQ